MQSSPGKPSSPESQNVGDQQHQLPPRRNSGLKAFTVKLKNMVFNDDKEKGKLTYLHWWCWNLTSCGVIPFSLSGGDRGKRAAGWGFFFFWNFLLSWWWGNFSGRPTFPKGIWQGTCRVWVCWEFDRVPRGVMAGGSLSSFFVEIRSAPPWTPRGPPRVGWVFPPKKERVLIDPAWCHVVLRGV